MGRLFRVPFQALHTWKGFPQSTNTAGVTCKTNNCIIFSYLGQRWLINMLIWKFSLCIESESITLSRWKYINFFFSNNDYFVCLPLGHRLLIKFFSICILFVSYFLIHVTSHLHTMFIFCIWFSCCIPCVPESNKVFESQFDVVW